MHHFQPTNNRIKFETPGTNVQNRIQFRHMYQRLCKPLVSHSFFLFGARGTGKTKLLQSLFPDHESVLWVDLLREGEVLQFLRSPNELRSRLDALAKPPSFVVIDEVQRVPSLLNEVHSLIEERQQKFALTGSSARKLRRGAANLLAGRALLNHLFPLTYRELGGDFSLERVLRWGSLPAVVNEGNPDVRNALLRTYVDVYLREEIREEQLVRNLDPFARFLEAAAQSSGHIINFSKIAREAGTDSKGVARYFQILEDTLLGFFLEPYHSSIRKRQRQQAKFYLFDIGVKRALEGALRTEPSPQTYEWGRAFEHLVILEAHRLNAYLQFDYKFSYLKTQGQLEIDLIVERRGEPTWAIEIKSAAEIDIVELRRLKDLAAAIPHSRPVVFCTAAQRKVIDGVLVIPWEQGIDELFSLPALGRS
jgi:predicted AAA+ superfamily ATPase